MTSQGLGPWQEGREGDCQKDACHRDTCMHYSSRIRNKRGRGRTCCGGRGAHPHFRATHARPPPPAPPHTCQPQPARGTDTLLPDSPPLPVQGVDLAQQAPAQSPEPGTRQGLTASLVLTCVEGASHEVRRSGGEVDPGEAQPEDP